MTQQPNSFLRRNGWLLVLAGAMVVIATTAGMTWASQRSTLDGQQAQIEQTKGELADIELQNRERIDANVLEALGISSGRLNTDELRIQTLLDTAFTWESGREYAAARDELKVRFDLTEKDRFLVEFMPPSRFSEDAEGKRYYYIDAAGMNSAIGDDPDIEVVQVKAGSYSYAVLVDVAVTADTVTQNNASNEQVTAHRQMLLFVTVDADGTLSDLSGVPASGSTRHSG